VSACALAAAPLVGEVEQEEDGEGVEEGPVQRILVGDGPETMGDAAAAPASGGEWFVTEDGTSMSGAMVAFLDLFDDRLRSLPTFIEAIREAADAGRLADEDTARIVAARARELHEMPRQAVGDNEEAKR
jgi:hypothetical protein